MNLKNFLKKTKMICKMSYCFSVYFQRTIKSYKITYLTHMFHYFLFPKHKRTDFSHIQMFHSLSNYEGIVLSKSKTICVTSIFLKLVENNGSSLVSYKSFLFKVCYETKKGVGHIHIVNLVFLIQHRNETIIQPEF